MATEDGRFWITFNGEVYNFAEIRELLAGRGYTFRSRTDTEVVLNAYREWGAECLDRFIGMFAFAVYDIQTDTMFVARDRLGIKPLYLAEYEGRVVAASELKAIVRDPQFPRDIDPRAVNLYLRFGYVPAPLSIFRGVRKLLPGHYAVIDRNGLRTQRYWDLAERALSLRHEAPSSEAEATERLDDLLRSAVKYRMIADVPVGAFLSGGVDSSLVVALMQEQSSSAVRTFTIGFSEKEYDESSHARAVARHLGTDHHEERCSPEDLLGVLPTVVETFDEPFADSSAIPTYLVSRLARRHVKVSLSGDGGDELFFGYMRYHAYARLRALDSVPRPARRVLGRLLRRVPNRRFDRLGGVLASDSDSIYGRFMDVWPPSLANRMTGIAVKDGVPFLDLRQSRGKFSELEWLSFLDLSSYLPDDILTKVDRSSMAVSLEARVPLLDHRVAEFATALPLRLKWRRGVTKRILRSVLYRRVPRALIERPKMGFGVPIDHWLRGPLREMLLDRVGRRTVEPLSEEAGPIAADAVRGHLDGTVSQHYRLWSLLILDLWRERWAGPPAEAIPAGSTADVPPRAAASSH